MKDRSCLADDVDCYSVDKIIIGSDTTISQYSFLCTASHDYRDPSMKLVTAPIIIGNNVWLAADVFVGPGITIGDGVVVTARSSIFTDLAPWVVAKGNPASVIRMRAFNHSGS